MTRRYDRVIIASICATMTCVRCHIRAIQTGIYALHVFP